MQKTERDNRHRHKQNAEAGQPVFQLRRELVLIVQNGDNLVFYIAANGIRRINLYIRPL